MNTSVSFRRQAGIALIFVLLLLLAMTLLGLAALRSTLLQERMSSNMYERSLAFQAAEAALRDAETRIQTGVGKGDIVGFDCVKVANTVCPAVPSNTYTGNAATGCALGAQECWVNGTVTPTGQVGPAQYYIQYLGQRSSEDRLGLGSSINQNQYGGTVGTSLEYYFRVIARSGDPSASKGRAIVVLQTNVTVDAGILADSADGKLAATPLSSATENRIDYLRGDRSQVFIGNRMRIALDNAGMTALATDSSAPSVRRVSWRELMRND